MATSNTVTSTDVNPVAPSSSLSNTSTMPIPNNNNNNNSTNGATPSSAAIQEQPPRSDFDTFQRGIKVIKWYRGPPVGKHIRQLKLSDDYSAITWQSKGAKRKLTLSEIDEVVKGLSNFSKDVKNPTQLDMSFTVHVNAGKDLEVTASKMQEFDILFNVLNYLNKNPNEIAKLNDGNRKNLTGPFDVFTWGFGGFGQLAQGDIDDRSTPTRIGGLSLSVAKGIKQIACGLEHIVLLAERTSNEENVVQTVYGFGNNGSMRLTGKTKDLAIVDKNYMNIGNGSFNPNYQQKLQPQDLACGDYHTLAIVQGNSSENDDTYVYAWGNNMFGQLGSGKDDKIDQAEPQKCVNIDGNIDVIAAGSMFSCAVTEDGALYTWGCNSEGQLGHGDCKDRFIPTKVKMLESEPVFDVACGDEFMCVMAGNNGNIYTWGSNSCGQLGHGDMDVRLVPTKVQHINPVRSIAAGAAHMCALVLGENGGEVLHTWGGGSKGQLGHGTFNNVLLPKLVNCDNLVEKAIRSIDCGAYHTAVVVGEDLYAWGDGSYNQLGTSSSDRSGNRGNNDSGNSRNMDERRSIRMSVANAMSLNSSNVRNNSGGTSVVGNTNILSENHGHSASPQIVLFKDKDGKSIKKAVASVACGGRFTVALVSRTDGEAGWVLDSEVNECMNNLCRGNRHGAPAKFNIITRKHHCRACGGIFCSDCSSHKVKLETKGYTKSVRVCDNCFQQAKNGLL